MRLGESAGKEVFSLVSTPTSSCNAAEDVKKLKGKNFSTAILAHRSLRTLQKHRLRRAGHQSSS